MFQKGLILVCLASLLSMSQLSAQDDFSIGPRVGLNFSNVSNVDNSESLTGLALGLTSTYSISESTGLTFDILASHEGYAIGDNEFKLSYVQIPIYFDVFFGDLGQAFRPKVYAGIVPGFLTGVKFNGDKVNKDPYSSFNLGLSGGLGFNARVVNRVWLNADLRAYMGISDVSASGEGEKVSLRTVQPSIGLCYGLSKI